MADASGDYIIAFRDGSGDFPKRIPPRSIQVLTVEWSWGFLNSRFDSYRAWCATGRNRVYVWCKDYYWIEGQEPQRFEPYCAGPLHADCVTSALRCIERTWEFERDESELDAPHMLGKIASKYKAEYSAILRRVWNVA